MAERIKVISKLVFTARRGTGVIVSGAIVAQCTSLFAGHVSGVSKIAIRANVKAFSIVLRSWLMSKLLLRTGGSAFPSEGVSILVGRVSALGDTASRRRISEETMRTLLDASFGEGVCEIGSSAVSDAGKGDRVSKRSRSALEHASRRRSLTISVLGVGAVLKALPLTIVGEVTTWTSGHTLGSGWV